METVTHVKPLKNYKLEIVFSDEVCTEIDIRPYIKSEGISQLLNDEAFFQTVKIDEAGGIAWNNGFDFCPVFLRQLVFSRADL